MGREGRDYWEAQLGRSVATMTKANSGARTVHAARTQRIAHFINPARSRSAINKHDFNAVMLMPHIFRDDMRFIPDCQRQCGSQIIADVINFLLHLQKETSRIAA